MDFGPCLQNPQSRGFITLILWKDKLRPQVVVFGVGQHWGVILGYMLCVQGIDDNERSIFSKT